MIDRGLKPYRSILALRTDDVVLFQQNAGLYAASLEGNSNQSTKLRIRKDEGDSFALITETEIWNGVRIATFPLESSTLIIVAENGSRSDNFEHQANVFQFNPKQELEIVHKINMSHSSDVAIWEDKQNIFMSVAQFMKEGPGGMTSRVEMPLYKWRGKHFDIVQRLGTSRCTRISPFAIGDVHFVALANSQADEGDEKTYSEILRYNVQTEEFEVFQRILTHACKDIRYFRIYMNNEMEHFLIVANFNNGDGDEYNGPPSIIYKFVDSYFIPFQSIQLRDVRQWEPITDSGNVLLIASTLDGLKFFQYDGWHFVDSKTNLPEIFQNGGIGTIRAYRFEEKNILVVVKEEYDTTITLFEITFSSADNLKRRHHHLLKWCQRSIEDIDDKDMSIIGDSFRGDIVEEPDSASQTKMSDSDTMKSTLDTYQLKLSQMEDIMKDSLQSQKEHTIKRNITTNDMILNNAANLNSANIETINNIELDGILGNTFDINEGFIIDSEIEYNFIRTEEPIFPKKINSHSPDDILRTNRGISVDTMTVFGNVNFKNAVQVVDKINNIALNSLLLLEGHQDFNDFNLASIDIKELKTNILNDRPLNLNIIREGKKSGVKRKDEPIVKHLDQLKVKSLVVGGFINDIDIPTLFKYALRKSGSHNITKTYYFDNIVVDNVETDTMSGKQVTTDLIKITGGKYNINKDIMFTNDLFVKNLTALEFLDNIPVIDGKLDILLKNSAEPQSVRGIKSFENLELLDAIKLQGKIRGKAFDNMNPVVRVNSDLERDGDLRITGDVVVEEMITSGNVVTVDGRNSLLRVEESGLELDKADIPIHLAFSQHINVEELFADRINNIDPASWLVNGAKQTQIVKGWKQFDGDLEITGDTEFSE
ncbi:hypothetical protein JTB14_016238 [Gonioctena quinquepunctata]|nr:hypothetical protein JTB14_016238 [Gonioctena quinquepunctata]